MTGNSDTADYKDMVLSPNQPVISNCGTVVVEKEVVDAEGQRSGRTTAGLSRHAE